MEPSAFLRCWDSKCTSLSIVSFNIHGARKKLQNCTLLHFLSKFDIVCLNEMKTNQAISMPGYMCYRGDGENSHRGGSAMLIKNYLVNHISEVSAPTPDCVWLKLKFLPHLTFMACYIPPSDSQYHSFAPLAEIQNRISTRPQEKYIVIGDMNARFGDSRRIFLEDKDLQQAIHYRESPDRIANPNQNARYIASSFKIIFDSSQWSQHW